MNTGLLHRNNLQLFAEGEVNIHQPEANNCFSTITQVIIEIPKQKNAKCGWKMRKSKCGWQK